jgi:hypothetical protein
MISHVDPQFGIGGGGGGGDDGGEIDAYIAHPNFHIWKILGALSHTRYIGEMLWYAVDHNCIRPATCKTAWPQQVIVKL